ncbi:MAG: hypothetical protein KME27_00005 [Lyngbya sp. HA4199-MV5]|jgi:hypothetical protein|nr:hypothetical protein [Lyngbya sp. HA4199-MV5]
MSTPFSQRWVALLAAPLVTFSAGTLHRAPATAANGQITSATVQGEAVAQRSSGLITQRSSGLIAQRSSGLIAQRSRIQRVRFAPGADSATIKASVVNGTRDLYLVGAQKGQVMSIRIVSLEDNAVFDVVAPLTGAGKRQTLKQEAFTWSSTLSATGDYQIVVGSTRGNASYRLQVTIR